MKKMDEIPSTPSSPEGSATANELLREVRLFVRGATNSSNSNQSDTVKSAIFLLKSLPAARSAVLEYLYSVFDEFVKLYVIKLDNNRENKSSNSHPSNTYLIKEINQILSEFVTTNSESWAPIIFNWSLDLLGRLSSKYGDKHGLQSTFKSKSAKSSDTLNNILDLWMKCKATKTLIHLSTQCLSTLMNSNVDICIDALLKMSVQHSPHFDWFIAHIGSCFPHTIIRRVLACGLKDFSNTSMRCGTTDNKNPKIVSVVEILSHLSSRHVDQINQAILSLMKDSVECANPTPVQLAVIPFILQLASISPFLISSLVPEIIKMCLNHDGLKKLPTMAARWKTMNMIESPESVVDMMVKLIIQSGNDGCRILNFLLEMAVPDVNVPIQVKETCAVILDTLLNELQLMVLTQKTDIPIFSSIASGISFIDRQIASNDLSAKSKWICRLFAYFCLNCDENISSQVVTTLLKKCADVNLLIDLLEHLEPSYPDLLNASFPNAARNAKQQDLRQIFENFVALIWLRKDCASLKKTLISNLDMVSAQINNVDEYVSSAALRFLTLVPLNEDTDVAIVTKLTYELVSKFYTYSARRTPERADLEFVVVACEKILSTVSVDSFMLPLVLRLLVKTSFSEEYGRWFGNGTKRIKRTDKNSFSLLEENQKHSRNIPLPYSHTTVLYSGVIGDGIRLFEEEEAIDESVILQNRNHLLRILRSCCVYDTSKCDPSVDSMSRLSLLLVELISPDVMFNGLPWPDEDFLKVTIERDISISRLLEENPVLWDILFLVARTKPALCYCSVILRGIAAMLLSFWSSCKDKSTSNCPKMLKTSKKLISLLSLGQLIPFPLSMIGEIFHELKPYEAFVVLNDIWKFMSDFIPIPESFVKNADGEMIRNSFTLPISEKYTVRLRHIMHSKLDKFGLLYSKMFANV